MYFSSLVISFLAATSTALTIRKPSFLDVGRPSDVDIAFMAAGKSIRSVIPLKGSGQPGFCYSRTDITMDAGALPPPSPGLTIYHIALGRGTQNYSCPTNDSAAAPLSLGALATLYNITCLKTPANNSVYSNLFTRIADSAPPVEGNPNESGHHYFTNGNVTATFNLHTPYLTGNLGISYSTKTANVSAPTPLQLGADASAPVPWLKLNTIGNSPKPATAATEIKATDDIGGVKEIYRLNTAGGAAPKTCLGMEGKTFQREYAAEYWFWH